MGILDQVVEDVVNAIRPKLSSAVAASIGTSGGTSGTSTTVASLPPIAQFYSGAGAGRGGGAGIPAGGHGFSSLPSLPTQTAGMALGQAAGQIVSNFGNLPSIQQSINMDLATSQAMAFGSAGSYAGVQGLQRQLANRGTVVSQADAMVALQQASLYGMGTGQNLNAYMSSAGSISNLMPGLGVAGAGQAFASLQSAQNVNMLRTMGVNIRSTGNQVTDFNSIINQIWQLLTNLSGRQPTETDIQGSMLPGNVLYRLLAGYGGDSNMQQSIYQGLLARAKGVTKFTKSDLQKFGFTTGAVTAQSQSQAADMARTQTGLEGLVKGFEVTTNVMSDFRNAMTSFLNLPGIKQIYQAKNAASGASSASSIIGGAISAVGSILPFAAMAAMADGGPTQSSTPYIIGEKGPEVFVPKTDGYIIPNHALPDGLKSGTYKYAASGADVKKWATKFLSGIGAPTSPANMNAIGIWAQAEGGWINNDAAFNPLDTTYKLSNSSSMNSSGVQAYANMNQGVHAAIATLLGNQADQRGYTRIVNALRNDKGTSEVLKAIDASKWGTHNFSGIAPVWDSKGPTYNIGGGGGIMGAISNVFSGAMGAVSGFLSSFFGGGSSSGTSGGTGSIAAQLSNSDISSYMSSLVAGPHFGTILQGERKQIAGARAYGGPVTAGQAYITGERGPEAFMPAGSGTAIAPRYVIEKVEINVPSNASAESIVEAFKRHTDIKEIERKARAK